MTYKLGVDPSHTATGLALIETDMANHVLRIVWTLTVRKHTLKKMDATVRALFAAMNKEGIYKQSIYSITVERGFQGEYHRGGLEVAEVGHDWGTYLYAKLGIEPQYKLAIDWRYQIFGLRLTADQAPKHCRLWCSQIKGYDKKMSEHACEAVAIAASGGTE